MSAIDCNDVSVQVVAIAKDEAPYIAEWVYHHLWFGFDFIHVYVNRTSDCTFDILGEINKKYPNVTYESADWVDLVGMEEVSRKLQSISYSLAFYKSKEVCDYVLFIDVDEFWISRDLKSSISDCLEELDYPDMVSFEWERVFGEEVEFSHLPQEVKVDRNGLVKSLVRTSLELKRMRLHVPVSAYTCTHVLSDGTGFIPLSHTTLRFSQFVRKDLNYPKKYFILHRMYRSEKEYIAALLRGNPEKRDEIKLNRKGFLRPAENSELIFFPEESFSLYREGVLKFYDECGVADLIDESRGNVVKAYNTFVEKLPFFYLNNPEKVGLVLDGVSDKKVFGVLEELRGLVEGVEGIVKEKKVSQAGGLRDLAFSFEKEGNVLSAYYTMCQALRLRPNGPLISKSVSRLAEEVLKKGKGGCRL